MRPAGLRLNLEHAIGLDTCEERGRLGRQLLQKQHQYPPCQVFEKSHRRHKDALSLRRVAYVSRHGAGFILVEEAVRHPSQRERIPGFLGAEIEQVVEPHMHVIDPAANCTPAYH
jgi:hypothetical protein